MYFDFDKSMFVKRAFDCLDEDLSGAIVSRTGEKRVTLGILTVLLRLCLQGFFEFVVGMWNYCTYALLCRASRALAMIVDMLCCWLVAGTLDRTAMLLFAFDMFDLDATGEIDGEEMARSLTEVCTVE